MTRAADPRKLMATARGRGAETVAALLLMARGYRILARRWASPAGEVDIVARRGRTLAFVEVKARPTEDEAIASLGIRQKRRIAMAAELWRAAHPRHAECDIRFDMFVVSPGRWPRHIRGAFDADA